MEANKGRGLGLGLGMCGFNLMRAARLVLVCPWSSLVLPCYRTKEAVRMNALYGFMPPARL